MNTILSLLLVFVTLCMGADANSPHPHQGILQPYTGPPPVVTLSQSELDSLASGGVVKQQLRIGQGGRGVAVQDVHADTSTVWSRIIDFSAYPNMVDNVKECGIYERSGDHIKVRFVLSATLFSIEYFIDHLYRPQDGYLTWTLDYSRESDLDDSVGFWRVDEIPDRPGWSRVTYSVDVQPRGWVPNFIVDLITVSGLTRATAWVKLESEKAAGNGN